MVLEIELHCGEIKWLFDAIALGKASVNVQTCLTFGGNVLSSDKFVDRQHRYRVVLIKSAWKYIITWLKPLFYKIMTAS